MLYNDTGRFCPGSDRFGDGFGRFERVSIVILRFRGFHWYVISTINEAGPYMTALFILSEVIKSFSSLYGDRGVMIRGTSGEGKFWNPTVLSALIGSKRAIDLRLRVRNRT
jgi:hypothetical protein